MKVISLAPSLTRNGGGVVEIQKNHARELKAFGVDVTAVGLEDEFWQQDKGEWSPTDVQSFQSVGPKFFGYSPKLREFVKQAEQTHQLLHLHVLWLDTSRVALTWKRRSQRPLIVSPNGMLEPWALKHRPRRKRIAYLLYERAMLENADCIIVNTNDEYLNIRSFGLKNPVAIIPNGVRLPANQSQTAGIATKRRLVFLGRIHPKKGLSELLTAWSRLEQSYREQWTLVIAGLDRYGYLEELKQQVDSFSLNNCVEFAGPQYGEAKDLFMRSADAFVLPSHSEGQALAVLEAWSYGLPVLATTACNLNMYNNDDKVAILVDPEIDAILRGLHELISMPPEGLYKLGQSGRLLVEREFCWTKIAKTLSDLYRWTVENKEVPSCVQFT